MDNMIFSILLVLIGLFVGIIIVFIINYIKGNMASSKAEKIIENAKKEADKAKRESVLEAKEEIHKLKIETDNEIKEKKNELKETEERIITRENNMDRRDQTLQNREQMLEEKENNLIDKQKDIQNEQVKIEEIKKEQIELLEKISGFSKKEAKELVLKKVEDMMNLEITSYIKDRESEAKLEADRKAKEMLVSCMQRYAGDVANEQTVTVVSLPNDEMKGRIIGREGRNIRTIEAVTGVDLIIDDTPEAIVISSFDPYRREIARVTLESLIKDGRIHPTRIEEIVEKMQKEVDKMIKQAGDEACNETGIFNLNPELVKVLGRLKYRTSYGQNVLKHSIETSIIAGLLASEMGANVKIAKRGGLLHDIGKALDHELEGTHVQIGVELARKYGENEAVVHCIEAHHFNVEFKTIEAVIVQVADAISSSRPGARRDSFENYIKRLQQLEEIANGFKGVEKSFAVQAGREVRIIVKPDQISDSEAMFMAKDIATKIENEMQYPGQIKVNVIRESRFTEVAK